MPSHNPECTHGGAHGYSECRDRANRPLEMLEDPISANPVDLPVSEAGNVTSLTESDREALRVALAGLSDHDPSRDPDSDADAAQRAGDQF